MIKVYQLTQPQNNFFVTIPFKGCKVEIRFEHGNVTKGIFAKFITNDRFRQRAVEASEMYGKLFRLVDTVKEPGDDAPAAPKPVKSPAPAPEKTTAAPKKPAEPKASKKKAEPEPAPEPEPTGTKMSFDGAAEAISYIATNFGEEVHTPEEAASFLAERGITAEIKS